MRKPKTLLLSTDIVCRRGIEGKGVYLSVEEREGEASGVILHF